MAVSIANLTSGSDPTSTTSWSTASITPTANNLILISFVLRNGSSVNPTVSSVTGNSLTWVLVNSINYDSSGTSRRTKFVYRALGSSPTSGAVTITAGETDSGAIWTVDQFSGVDTSGTNGSGAIVQSATNKDEAASSSTLTVTLSAFSSSANATFGVFASADGNDTTTAGTGFSKIGDVASTNANVAIRLTSEFKSTNDTSVDMTFLTAGQIGGIAIEIKAAAASTTYPGYYGSAGYF
jgi:hypothetical protein